MEFLIGEGRGLAIFGLLLIVLGVFYMPDSWDQVIAQRNARFGIAISGLAAIIIGFAVATFGG